ncbi:MAG: FtsX-like permease family protein [Acidobacteriota bacterium]|jgi:putative ABC transport system permease protein
MKPARLIFRSLFHYWRTNLPVIAGIATAVAVMSGALMVGRSVRGSLKDLLFERIGNTEAIITADRFFSEDLAVKMSLYGSACPIVYLKGVLIQESSRMRMHKVNVYGVDERFWTFQGMPDQAFHDDRAALIGSPLAQQMDVDIGDVVLLQVEMQQSIPREWVYGQRESMGKTVRLTCRNILPSDMLGEFALRSTQGDVYSIFVPISRLQEDLDQPALANAILLTDTDSDALGSLKNTLVRNLALEDLGLKLKDLQSGKGFLLESHRILLTDPIADAAVQSAKDTGLSASPVYTYLANSIRANGSSIPYSAITAADLDQGAMKSIEMDSAENVVYPDSGVAPIYLTDWAARDLNASPEDSIEVEYFIWLEAGKLVTRTMQCYMAGVVATSGEVNDSLAPDIPGITGAGTIASWDPPFPLDLKRIRKKDEDYWDRYRATPKAFVPLSVGQQLWETRFGKLTSVRFSLNNGKDMEAAKQEFTEIFLSRLKPENSGFLIQSIKEKGVAASRGSTDFAEYFIYFSFFLIISAMLLAVLFFKLTIEQRVKEIGILKVAGVEGAWLRRLFFSEGLILSALGCIVGIVGSLLYGSLMVYGLRTWWMGAVGTSRLTLHFNWQDLAAGAVSGLCFSLATVAWTIRVLKRNSPRSLLTGTLESIAVQGRRARILGMVSVFSAAAALTLLIAATFGALSQLVGFFVAGFLSLVSILCATAYSLRRYNPRPITGNGWPALLRLGIRNARHRPGRSLLCAALIASATFTIVSTEAFRRSPDSISLQRDSGTGGYPYLAEASLPVIHDLNSTDGREALGIRMTSDFDSVRFVSFRERPGDDTSCLNLYTPQEPKILGVPVSFLKSGRFSFKSSLASNPEQSKNPWLLLDAELPDGAIPAIADANTIQYILHLSVGSDLTIQTGDGSPARLRFAAALDDSIFQGGILISETNFLKIFPDLEGYRFFLIDMTEPDDEAAIQPLKESLGYWGIRIESSLERLSSFHEVENTYLSTFQSLGTLGLILGTLGLATVLLRNVLERRSELALLRAAGFRRRILSGIVLSENILLLLWGSGTGIACALISIAPALYSRGDSLPILMVVLVLIPVLIAGILASLAAVIAVFRSPLLPALRSE